MVGQIATFAECLHLSYDDIVNVIPYRTLCLMARDKVHVVYGTLVKKRSGRDMMARKKQQKKKKNNGTVD